MVRVEHVENVWPKQIRFYANEGNFDRQLIFAYCYPEYDDQIRLKLNSVGLGFQLNKQDARALCELLTKVLKEMK